MLKIFVHLDLCVYYITNSFLASGEFCRRLITFANSLDPDQDGQNLSPDLDLNSLTFW